MKLNKFLIAVLIMIAGQSINSFGQAYLKDAKELLAFKQLYQINLEKIEVLKATNKKLLDSLTQLRLSIDAAKKKELDKLVVLAEKERERINSIDLNSDLGRNNLAELALLQSRSTGTDNNQDGVMPGADDVGGFDVDQSQTNDVAGGEFDEFIIEKTKKEIEWFIAFAKASDAIFRNNVFVVDLKDFPNSFEYLKHTVQALEKSSGTGGFTAVGLGSLVGISEAEILKGITDWALKRAQEELMQAFLREWLDKLLEDPVLTTTFPSTLNMLSTSDLSSIFTDGDTWKATFQQDFDNIPSRIPQIIDVALKEANDPVPPQTKKEMISGLSMMVDLFGELDKNKKPDDILLLLGEESFLRASTLTIAERAVIDRSMTAINFLLTSLKKVDDSGRGYTPAQEILELTDEETKAFWQLIYLRERSKMKIVFSLASETDEAAFYDNVVKNITEFKVQISKVSENIVMIAELLKSASNSEIKKLDAEQFHTYVLLVFDIVENGLNIIEELNNRPADVEIITKYKAKYLKGFEYVSQIQEGIKANQYGKVALNTLNILTMIKDCARIESEALPDMIVQMIELETIIASITGDMNKVDIKAKLTEIKNSMDTKFKSIKIKFPRSYELVVKKFNSAERKLTKIDTIQSQSNVINIIKKNFSFSKADSSVVYKEVAENLASLQTSSEDFNKYAKLMASIVLAKDSDDIQEALEGVAMKSGGYLVRQKSAFSASITFYPGFEFGWEELSQQGTVDESTKGKYMGATLPLGIELAKGTNWRPIGAVGVFLQFLDLGAVLNYSVTNESDSVSTLPKFGFEQVLSPGAYVTVHLSNNPITFGGGVSFSPDLRVINNGSTTLQANALQGGFFIAIDLNVIPLFTSRKKYPLKSKSFNQVYGKN